MESYLPIAYISGLLGLLAIAAVAVFRQVLETQKTEKALSRLQGKLGQEKGTAQEYYELGSILLDKRIYVQAITQFQKQLKQKR